MLELIVGTYGFVCWLLFKRLKLIPVNTYTIVTAILGGVVILVSLLLLLSLFHPVSKDGRLYAYTTPIVPDVKGIVVSVPVEPNKLLEKGDVLFQIDPMPYQLEVDRLEGALAAANTGAAQLEERVSAAVATTNEAKALLEASESELDMQTREKIEQARAISTQARTQRDFAEVEYNRNQEQLTAGIISRQQLDVFKQRFETADAQLKQAEAAVRQAEQSLGSGESRIQSAREQVQSAEAAEREARLALASESKGLNPEVRQILAELEQKRLDLEATTVRAPAKGFATQVMLRPGQMAVSMPFAPTMVFVQGDRPELIASFPQNVLTNFHPGLEAELAFKMYPGQIFKAKLKNVAVITPEGQILATGVIRTVASAKTTTRIPVVFEYGADVEALGLPPGAQATVAVYTEKMHVLSIIRKILLRIKSWEHYLFSPF